MAKYLVALLVCGAGWRRLQQQATAATAVAPARSPTRQPAWSSGRSTATARAATAGSWCRPIGVCDVTDPTLSRRTPQLRRHLRQRRRHRGAAPTAAAAPPATTAPRCTARRATTTTASTTSAGSPTPIKENADTYFTVTALRLEDMQPVHLRGYPRRHLAQHHPRRAAAAATRARDRPRRLQGGPDQLRRDGDLDGALPPLRGVQRRAGRLAARPRRLLYQRPVTERTGVVTSGESAQRRACALATIRIFPLGVGAGWLPEVGHRMHAAPGGPGLPGGGQPQLRGRCSSKRLRPRCATAVTRRARSREVIRSPTIRRFMVRRVDRTPA